VVEEKATDHGGDGPAEHAAEVKHYGPFALEVFI
jgi:hypothetical protein